MEDQAANTQPDDVFSNLAEVLLYLQEAGWRVTKSTLYRHQGEGKILPRNDGAYHQRDIGKYAKTFLKQTGTGKRVVDRIDDLQRRKIELELKNLELDNQRKERAQERELGLYVSREQIDLEFAALAGIMDAALKSWVQFEAAGWIRLVNGEGSKVGELVVTMMRTLDEQINNLSRDREYEIAIESEEIQTDEDTEGDAEIIDEEVA